MKKIRITVRHSPEDPADDVRVAAHLRRDLWAYSPVEIAPYGRKHATRRDAESNAYFEFVTDYPDEVQRVLNEYGYSERAKATVVAEESGPECANCGNIAGTVLPTVCPTCHFRDISPCPNCNQEVPRQSYLPVSGDLFQCPMCDHRVRFHMHDPLFDANGRINQPMVVIDKLAG
jgi:hypothetical protein